MKNYEVIPYHMGNSDYVWCVLENSTEQVIKSFYFEEDADDYCEFLNKGGAFNGNTPTFILRCVDLKKINESFTEAFV